MCSTYGLVEITGWLNGSETLFLSNKSLDGILDGGCGNYSETEQETRQEDGKIAMADIYEIWVPLILCFCALTFLSNVFIVVAAHWMRRPLTPTMFFSLSLAVADAMASLNVGLGLILHSLLPRVYKIKISPCPTLTLEAVRLSSVIVTVVHLLALAINHYIGIVKPLHYAAIMTKRAVTIIVIGLWIVPNAAVFIYFSAMKNQGFQSPNCTTEFLKKIRFRAQYASFFFAPLLIMIFIYGHIFIIIRRHQANRQALIQHTTVSISSRHSSNLDSTRSSSLRHHTHKKSSSSYTNRRYKNSSATFSRHHKNTSSMTEQTSENVEHQNSVVSRNIKAIITTLLIVGTFIFGWIPAVVWYLVYCENCIFPFGSVQPNVSIAIGITVNSLIVLKSFLDPIIYTFRMNDFQVAFHRMRYQFTSKCCRPNKREEGQEVSTMISLNQSVLLRNNSHNQSPNFHQTSRLNRSSNHHLSNYHQTQADHNLIPNEQTTTLVTVNETEPNTSTE